jgi:hypothetical protein
MVLTAPDCRRNGAQEPRSRSCDRNSQLSAAGPLIPGGLRAVQCSRKEDETNPRKHEIWG